MKKLVGRSFRVFDWPAFRLTGEFEIESPYVWDTSRLYTQGEITLVSFSDVLPGDYSRDGAVDAADYTVWKDAFGSTSNLAADGNGDGFVDVADYTVWKDNFGAERSFSETPKATTVPEGVWYSWLMWSALVGIRHMASPTTLIQLEVRTRRPLRRNVER
ncbi:MAG: dockerin type I repeat-containing protein [Pirellulaceae bacterium]|nr:dockerin type I repeat-containing protein [Planctomycetales bacterium]